MDVSFVNPFLYPIITSNKLKQIQRNMKTNMIIPRNSVNRNELNQELQYFI